jgi:hypothetical protein
VFRDKEMGLMIVDENEEGENKPEGKPSGSKGKEKIFWMYYSNETKLAYRMSWLPGDEEFWLPKSKCSLGAKDSFGRFEVTMPDWLAKKKRLDAKESATPDEIAAAAAELNVETM